MITKPQSIQEFADAHPQDKELIRDMVKAYREWGKLLEKIIKHDANCAVCDLALNHHNCKSGGSNMDYNRCCDTHADQRRQFDIRKVRIELGFARSTLKRFTWCPAFSSSAEGYGVAGFPTIIQNPLMVLGDKNPDKKALIEQAVKVYQIWEDYLRYNHCTICSKPCEDSCFRYTDQFINCCEEHKKHTGVYNFVFLRKKLGYPEDTEQYKLLHAEIV